MWPQGRGTAATELCGTLPQPCPGPVRSRVHPSFYSVPVMEGGHSHLPSLKAENTWGLSCKALQVQKASRAGCSPAWATEEPSAEALSQAGAKQASVSSTGRGGKSGSTGKGVRNGTHSFCYFNFFFFKLLSSDSQTKILISFFFQWKKIKATYSSTWWS